MHSDLIGATEYVKRCSKCGVTKPYDEFPKHGGRKSSRDALYSWCKECTYARNAEYQRTHPRPSKATGAKRGPKPRPKEPKGFKPCADCGRQKITGQDWAGSHCDECKKIRRRKKAGEVRAARKGERLRLKRELVEMMGGACSHCGYNAYLAGMTFHHVDSDSKDIAIGAFLDEACQGKEGIAYRRMMEELKKCILLCFNCHMALHAGEWAIDNDTE